MVEGECSASGNPSLLGLPSRGNFTSIVPSSSLGGLRVYVCDRDPGPEAQIVKTDSTNILIRSLMLKKPNDKEAQQDKATKQAETPKKKRAATDKPETSKSSKKKKKEASGSGSVSYDGYTVEMLRAALKEKGLPVKGRKTELLARLKQAS